MLRNISVALVSAVIVGLGIVFQVFGTTSHEVHVDDPGVSEQADGGTAAPVTGAPAARAGDETNNETGKPGEAPKE